MPRRKQTMYESVLGVKISDRVRMATPSEVIKVRNTNHLQYLPRYLEGPILVIYRRQRERGSLTIQKMVDKLTHQLFHPVSAIDPVALRLSNTCSGQIKQAVLAVHYPLSEVPLSQYTIHSHYAVPDQVYSTYSLPVQSPRRALRHREAAKCRHTRLILHPLSH